MAKPKKPKNVPLQPIGRGITADYARALRKVLQDAFDRVDRELIPQLEYISISAGNYSGTRKDASWPVYLAGLVNSIDTNHNVIAVPAYNLQAESHGLLMSNFNERATNRNLSSIIGVDVATSVVGYSDLMNAWTIENVNLIQSVDSKFFNEIEGMVSRGVRNGTRPETMSKEIRSRYGVTKNRANLIARDQMAKLNGQLTRHRQESLGITEYIWRTSQDERVRTQHSQLNGKRFKYSEPPISCGSSHANPGQCYQCRCTASPVINVDELWA